MVDWAAGAVEVGETAGAGAPKANVKKRAGSWRANVRRMISTTWTMDVKKGHDVRGLNDSETVYDHSSNHARPRLSLLEKKGRDCEGR